MTQVPPLKNTPFTLYLGVVTWDEIDDLRANPTIAVGDFKVSVDGGAFTNLATLPDVYPATGRQIRTRLSASEMDDKVVAVLGSDAAGEEWADAFVVILTAGAVKGEAFTIYTVMTSQADGNIFQVNPTIAAGDFKVSTDGGALTNPATLPVVAPAGSKQIKIELSASEVGNVTAIIGTDAAGDEWEDRFLLLLAETASATRGKGSFARMASVTASTKRSPGITGGLEGAYATEIASLACLPLDPVDPELALPFEGLSWHETLQTAVDASLDIVEGDLLVVDSTEYPVRAVEDWDWGPTGEAYRILYLEDPK